MYHRIGKRSNFMEEKFMHFFRLRVALVVLVGLFPASAASQVAQEAVDQDVMQRIREEGLERSQIEPLARHLTEVIGPRLTGSPAMKRANEWTAETFRGWGLENVAIDSWGEFGRGWQEDEFDGVVMTPYPQKLQGRPLAWSGDTKGRITGPVMIVRPESIEDLDKFGLRMGRAFILIDPPREISPEFEHRDRRTATEDLLAPVEARGGGGNTAARQARIERFRAQRELYDATIAMAQEVGAAAIIRNSSRGDGVISGSSGGSRDPDADPIAQVMLPAEQYNQIYRNVESGLSVLLKVQVKTRFFGDDLDAYNTLAEIPGTDKADEFVMVGAHLDSWHLGNGATDNAAGSVVMMEAMRILKALDLQPRRTVRIALWSGEEQGLLGSRGWVANNPDLHSKISAYLNLDNGTGRVRGIWDQSNEKAIPVFEQLLGPFEDLGVVAVRHGNTGGTDHLAFDAAGIPGFNFIQDPIEYGINTHHTELDTFDHLLIEDLQQAAVIVASTLYHLAMRDEMMPRKDAAPVSDGF